MMECSMVDFIKDWGGILISGAVAIGSAFAYLKHDRKLKEQEAKLNDLQIAQHKKEADKEKMAEMKASFTPAHKGVAKLRIVNAGRSDANNVKVEILATEEVLKKIQFLSMLMEYDTINPQSYREERVFLYEGSQNTVKLKITWDDDYQSGRSVILTVPF